MHNLDASTEIAGRHTCRDWQVLRQRLTNGAPSDLWRQAYETFLLERVTTRYLKPIEAIEGIGAAVGEGFAVATIQCAMVEFLEATVQGRSYRYLRKGETLGPHEYSSSSKLFLSFLTTRSPFSNEFTEDLAGEYYRSIRCGLLHEARTRTGWLIWVDDNNDRIIDGNARILYRDRFQAALLLFLARYCEELMSTKTIQDAFVRKFDRLCGN